MYDFRYDFLDNFVIFVILILEIWFKVMVYILLKCMLQLNVSQIWLRKENIIMFLVSDFGWID